MVALLGSAHTLDGEERFKRLVGGVRNNVVDALPVVDISPNDKRRMLRQVGLQKDPGTNLADVPIAGLPSAAIAIMERHFRKLGLALYYRELKAIAPPDSLVGATIVPNATFMNPEAFAPLTELFRFIRPTKLKNRDISAQFAYRCDLGMDGKLFGALVKLHRSVVGIVTVCTDRKLIEASDSTEWYDLGGTRLAT